MEKVNCKYISKKIIIIDNIDVVKSEKDRGDIIKYFSNFYDYIISFTNMSYELSLLREGINGTDELKIKHCAIKELGHKQRDLLYRKWYKLDDGTNHTVDDEVEKKVKEATNAVNTLRGNGYMPSIPPNIIILLQQLEFQTDNNQDKSNYGYMYSFLINKAILDMKKNSASISDDIAFGILICVAKFMLDKRCRVIDYYDFGKIVEKYNKRYITDASQDVYLSEYEKVDLIEFENEQIKFKYPYIHYYFTAKYLADHISEQYVKDIVCEMASNLQDEECGDIMIFLCHLSKKEYLFESVLQSSKEILKDVEMFDFNRYKNINICIDEFLQTDFLPEEGEEERKIVNQGHFCVNGKKVDIPSYLCKAGDTLSIKKASLDSEKFKAVLEANASRPVPQWLDTNAGEHAAKIVALPERDQILVPVEEHLIVEFYSK